MQRRFDALTLSSTCHRHASMSVWQRRATNRSVAALIAPGCAARLSDGLVPSRTRTPHHVLCTPCCSSVLTGSQVASAGLAGTTAAALAPSDDSIRHLWSSTQKDLPDRIVDRVGAVGISVGVAMSKDLGYKQVSNVNARRTWDNDYYEAKAKERLEKGDDFQDKDDGSVRRNSNKEEFQPAPTGAAGPAGSARAYLKASYSSLLQPPTVAAGWIYDPSLVRLEADTGISSSSVRIQDGVIMAWWQMERRRDGKTASTIAPPGLFCREAAVVSTCVPRRRSHERGAKDTRVLL